MIFRKIINLLFFAFFIASQVTAQDISKKANDFIETLSPELASVTLFSLTDEERFNMNYIPTDRKGPTFHDFNKDQKQAAFKLLRASLSKEGYRKTKEITELEEILKIIEEDKYKATDGTSMRDPLNYHFCIFGDPSPTEFWGWRFEGHHVSLNFSSSNGEVISATPSFFGSNPGIVKIKESRGKEVLRMETDLGFMLVNSLDKEQLKMAKYSETAPKDIITGTKMKVEEIDLIGIPFDSFTESQKRIFLALLNVYVDNYDLGFSDILRDRIDKAGLENLHFSWAGGLKPGLGHYYRIHGPMLIIEYDNTQNNANHVHVVLRDLSNDYGEEILKNHYKKDH